MTDKQIIKYLKEQGAGVWNIGEYFEIYSAGEASLSKICSTPSTAWRSAARRFRKEHPEMCPRLDKNQIKIGDVLIVTDPKAFLGIAKGEYATIYHQSPEGYLYFISSRGIQSYFPGLVTIGKGCERATPDSIREWRALMDEDLITRKEVTHKLRKFAVDGIVGEDLQWWIIKLLETRDKLAVNVAL